ncbi:MAG TPA: septation protein IspZ [Candidatus Paceibacterota bacterium]
MLTRSFVISFFIEFGPVIAFFFGTEFLGFFPGTTFLVVGTLVALSASLVRDKRLPMFSILSSVFILFFGLLTLFMHDPIWLVAEYTLYNGLFGLFVLGGLYFNKSLLKPLFQTMFHVSDKCWRILSLRWGIAFILTAISNELVWRLLGEDAWVYFRLIAGVLLAVFGFSQFFLARRERHPDASPWGLRI